MRTVCLTFAFALLATACGDSPEDTTAPATTTGTMTTGTPTTGEGCGMGSGLMSNYGAPCEVDADCVDVIGTPDAKCLHDILGVYGLPCGYCSNFCSLPDANTTYVKMASDCFMGADCIGLDGYFEGCVPACTSNADCPRDGYECRRMPTISKEGDPTYCLMTDENML